MRIFVLLRLIFGKTQTSFRVAINKLLLYNRHMEKDDRDRHTYLYDSEHDRIVRNSYITDIALINPVDVLEAQDIQETLEWLKKSPELHKPFNMQRHLGVLSMMLSQDRKETFLINHKKAQKWLPPGGHVDKGLTLQQAIELEIQEELQAEPIFISPHPFLLTQTLTTGLNAGHIDVTSWFIMEGDSSIQYNVQEKEASEAKWLKISELLNNENSSHLHRALSKLEIVLK